MTPDVNVLVAAFRPGHVHHAPARKWLRRAIGESTEAQPLQLLPVVACGVMRVLTHPKLFADPSSLVEAANFLDTLTRAPGVRVGSVGPAEWVECLKLCEDLGLRGNAVPNALIAAWVLQHHDHLVTFDRGFRKLLPRRALTVLK